MTNERIFSLIDSQPASSKNNHLNTSKSTVTVR